MFQETELICPELFAAKARSMQAFKLMDEILRLAALTIFLLVQVIWRILLNICHQVHLFVPGVEMVKYSDDAPVTVPLFATLTSLVEQFAEGSGFTSGHTG